MFFLVIFQRNQNLELKSNPLYVKVYLREFFNWRLKLQCTMAYCWKVQVSTGIRALYVVLEKKID